ncbi:hypothetical protein C2G38_2100819 [Gigaspora rosea]|uniref:Uncharacterized protein n=1 Tax=Gigaspora rosea TaxID=44941 RepID=A0A397UUV4_9GLOM|nr:hypothetical protein C2G38_2100819 [Gigaspora rosea]
MICESIQKYKVKYVYPAPAIIIKLANDPLAQQYILSSLDMTLSGESKLDDKWEENFMKCLKYQFFMVMVLLKHVWYYILECSSRYNIIKLCAYCITMRIYYCNPGSVGILIPYMKDKILSDYGVMTIYII